MNELNTQHPTIEEQKARFVGLVNSLKREGADRLLQYLETKTDFFTAPASTKFHNNFVGGLMEHSLNVYDNFKKLLEAKNIAMDEDSIIIASLFHDLCKCNFYVREERNRKVNGRWEQYEVWSQVKETSIPLPHASRSIRIIRSYLSLKFIEELCIFYHMGPFGGEDYEYRNMMQQTYARHPETLLFYLADTISSYIDEEIREP